MISASLFQAGVLWVLIQHSVVVGYPPQRWK